MRTYHIPIFVPHKGCPHDCVFCNQRHITGHSGDVCADDVTKTIEYHLKTIQKDSHVEVAFFGGSFTGIDISLQTELLEAAYPYVSSGRVSGIRCSTRPDYISTEILDNLRKYGVTCIELGVQSTDSDVLLFSARGHDFDSVISASKLIKSYGIELGLQMMLGLPGDNLEKMKKTADDLILLKPSCVRIYPTLVVPDTSLWSMYAEGTYIPLDIEEAVEALAVILPKFYKNNIPVIRVGLQTTDEINENTVVGPYHSAIRELAEGRIIRNILERYVVESKLEVSVSSRCVSKTVGHGRCNKIYFRKKYGLELRVTVDDSIGNAELKINDKIVAIY